MADIKVKDKSSKDIKTLNKGMIATEKFKDNIVEVKEKSESNQNKDDNVSEYGANKVQASSSIVAQESVYNIKKYGGKSVAETQDNIKKSKLKIKSFKEKQLLNKTSKEIGKNSKIAIKTGENISKNSKKVAKESMKASQRALKLARETAKKTAKGIRVAFKATISSIKAIIAGTKALIAALIAGGSIAMIVVVVICLVGLLVGSIFGIFFSSEKTGKNSITMNQVVTQINQELAAKITNIKSQNQYDDFVINSDRAEWKDVLAIYTVKVSNGYSGSDVMMLDNNKINILKGIFWDMNTISSEIKTESVDEDMTGKHGTPKKVQKKILYINISHKSIDEMKGMYHFSAIQIQQLNELLNSRYENLWSSAIYGVSLGSPKMVQIALSQVGNVGGEPYWSWYGFSQRVEWCACFVSWVANEAGYINSYTIPKFSGVKNGIDWFKAMGEWKGKNYVPKSGDIIFFDWEDDGVANHVGIVEKVENNKIHTIEGNSTNDSCLRKEYTINNNVIYGYGKPAY